MILRKKKKPCTECGGVEKMQNTGRIDPLQDMVTRSNSATQASNATDYIGDQLINPNSGLVNRLNEKQKGLGDDFSAQMQNYHNNISEAQEPMRNIYDYGARNDLQNIRKGFTEYPETEFKQHLNTNPIARKSITPYKYSDDMYAVGKQVGFDNPSAIRDAAMSKFNFENRLSSLFKGRPDRLMGALYNGGSPTFFDKGRYMRTASGRKRYVQIK